MGVSGFVLLKIFHLYEPGSTYLHKIAKTLVNENSKRIWFSSIVICIIHPKSLCIISQLINRHNAHFIYIIFLSKERIFLQLLLHIFYTDQNQIIEIIGYKAFRYLHLATTNSDECLTGVSSRPCPWCDLTRKFARKSTSGANRLPLRN